MYSDVLSCERGIGCVGMGRHGGRGVVLRIPWWGRFMWPFAVAGLGLRYLVTPLAVKFGHPLRKPLRMALSRVDIRGLHRDWWANFMLLALVRTVWVNKLTCFDEGFFFSDVVAFPPLLQAWALAHTRTASGSCISSCLTWVVLPATIGRVHRSVVRSFKQTKIVLLLY
jgi:hypothetical protein